MTLQRKLLLVSLATLLLPVAGWLYLRQMDTVLRESQQRALESSAAMLARTVNAWVRLPEESAWHVQHSVLPLVVDGYAEDWNRLAAWAEPVPDNGRLLLGEHAGALYLLLSIEDTTADRLTVNGSSGAADHVDLWLGLHGRRCRYRLAAAAPGVIRAAPDNPPADGCPDPLRAQWQEDGSGYRVEARLPSGTSLGYLGVRAVDASSAAADPAPILRPLQRFSRDLSQRLAALLPDDGRVRLVDRQGWVVAQAGRLVDGPRGDAPGWLSTAAYQALVAHDMHGSAALDQVAPQLEAAEVWQALSGIPATSWRSSVTRARITLTAAVPLPGAGDPRGAIVLEQARRAMPLLNHRGLLWLLLGSIALLLVAGAVLTGFALRLGTRLRRLRDAVRAAASRPGDHQAAALPDAGQNDELGDLARSHQDLMQAVAGYTGYLRTLASKLSHELNTPIAIVTSSLENLDQARLPAEQQTYLQRAREGSERLNALVRAMGAAGRIEQAISQSEGEDFDLRLLVAGCADGYRLLAGDRAFELELPVDRVPLHGAPDLIVQALDKLFDNALSFTPEDGWMRLSLRSEQGAAVIGMANQGPPLAEPADGRLFDSLVSLREPAESRRKPHLGLGLYIVRLIAQQHGGSIRAENLTDGRGVVFRLRLVGMSRRPLAAPADDDPANPS